MLGLNSELESSCLPEQLRYLIQFSHAFEYDANANRLGGCFCLGSGPVCLWLFASLSPLAKRKSGWGICESSFLCGCFSFVSSICIC